MTKTQFKSRLKDALYEKNRQDILAIIKTYKKLDYSILMHEKCELKEFFHTLTLEQARIRFSLEAKTFWLSKIDFSSHKDYENELWNCDFCLRVSSLRHFKICPYFEEQRQGKNIEKNEQDLILYFQEIMTIRMENN